MEPPEADLQQDGGLGWDDGNFGNPRSYPLISFHLSSDEERVVRPDEGSEWGFGGGNHGFGRPVGDLAKPRLGMGVGTWASGCLAGQIGGVSQQMIKTGEGQGQWGSVTGGAKGQGESISWRAERHRFTSVARNRRSVSSDDSVTGFA